MKASKVAVWGRQVMFNSQRFASAANDVEAIKKAREAKPFLHKDLQIKKTQKPMPKPKPGDPLPFGGSYSDHMLEVDWSTTKGWARPIIQAVHPLELHPGAKCLHYAIELFEGMKAYRGVDGKIRLFRPEQNMERMRRSALRSALPDFSAQELLKCIKDLVALDRDWVPKEAASLYLRPTMIGTDKALGVGMAHECKLFVVTGPVGAYFPGSVTLLADPDHVRAYPGGVGSYKMGCNYAPSIMVSTVAMSRGCHQVLWLYGPNEDITEVGTMNIMFLWKNNQGEMELVTPPLDNGIILPGVTRDSLLQLAKQWNEFKVSERYVGMKDIRRAIKEKRMYEMFGVGTAAVVSPVGKIVYKNKDLGDYEELPIPTEQHKPNIMQRLYKNVLDIQYGRIEQPGWTQIVC